MSKKKPFVLRLSPVMMEQLESWSADEFRSVNGQIEWIIQQALVKAGRAKVSVSAVKNTNQLRNQRHEPDQG